MSTDGYFDAFRSQMGWTRYGENHSKAHVDVTFLILLALCVIFSVASLISILGLRGKEKWTTFLRVLYSLFICQSILFTIFGSNWQVSELKSSCTYMAHQNEDIQANIKVNIGLMSVNITLEADELNNNANKYGPLYYNERITWKEIHDAKHDYEKALQLGAPYPILVVAEYLSVDEGGLRWNRGYRQAGYFVYILLWTSFAFWILTNIMLCMVVFYGVVLLTLTGLLLVMSAVLYHILQPAEVLSVPFQEGFIQLSYGWCFWLILVAGVWTILVGFVLLVLEQCQPEKMANFFLVDTSMFDEEVRERLNNEFEVEIKDTSERERSAQILKADPNFSFGDLTKLTKGIDGKRIVGATNNYVNHGYVPEFEEISEEEEGIVFARDSSHLGVSINVNKSSDIQETHTNTRRNSSPNKLLELFNNSRTLEESSDEEQTLDRNTAGLQIQMEDNFDEQLQVFTIENEDINMHHTITQGTSEPQRKSSTSSRASSTTKRSRHQSDQSHSSMTESTAF